MMQHLPFSPTPVAVPQGGHQEVRQSGDLETVSMGS